MKILLIHDFSNELGGGELHVQQLTKLLKSNNLEVINYYGASKNSIFSAIFSFFNIKHLVKLSLLLHKNKDLKVLHLHGTLYNLSPSIYLLKLFFDIKIIQTIHAFQYYCPRTFGIYEDGNVCKCGFNNTKCLYKNCNSYFIGRKYILWYFYKWLKIFINRFFIKRYVNIFLCPSKNLQELMIITLNLAREKIIYLPNFIELEKNYCLNFENIDDKSFLYVGRLSKLKGVGIIIKSFDILINKNGIKDLYLNIIGDGPEKENLENLVKKFGLENNIMFLGKIDNNKLKSYYEGSIGLIMPSICLENNPLVAIEGMKYGKPIIASNVGGYPDLVEEGKNGYLFHMGNHIELANKIKNLYKNKDLSINMGKYGFEKLKLNFSSEKFYSSIIEIYNKSI